MIVWGKQVGNLQLSEDPRGYSMALSPYGNKCHLQAMHLDSDGRITCIGQRRDLDAGYRPGIKKAASDLRAACAEHWQKINEA